jgi:ribonuclease PH
VVLGSGKIVEVQMSAEGSTFSRDQMSQLMDLAELGVSQLVTAQLAAVS